MYTATIHWYTDIVFNRLGEKEEEFILNEIKHYQDSDEHYTFEETFRD